MSLCCSPWPSWIMTVSNQSPTDCPEVEGGGCVCREREGGGGTVMTSGCVVCSTTNILGKVDSFMVGQGG